jgi:hypothetical protein
MCSTRKGSEMRTIKFFAFIQKRTINFRFHHQAHRSITIPMIVMATILCSPNLFCMGNPIFSSWDGYSLQFEGAVGDDYILAGALAIPLSQLNGATVDVRFLARPYSRLTLVNISEHRYRQYREFRFLPAVTFSYSFPRRTTFMIGLRCGAGYSFGDFSGSKQTPVHGFAPLGGITLYWRLNDFIRWGIGYQYAKFTSTIHDFGLTTLDFSWGNNE